MVKIFSIEEIVTASNSILNRDQKSISKDNDNLKYLYPGLFKSNDELNLWIETKKQFC